MAKKSKTQRAKASAARQQRKAERENVEAVEEKSSEEQSSDEKPKKLSLKKSAEAASDSSSKKVAKKEDKPKKKRFQFLRDVRGEMKRVTWPTRVDVAQWTGVVIVALLFFGIFVAVLDNVVITPLLVLWSGIGG